MDIETASRLLEYRKKNGYSQEELAEKIGVSRQAISKWERSESSPDTDNLIALSKLYNVSIDELLNGKTETEPAPAPQKTESESFKYEATFEAGEQSESHTARNAVISLIGLIAFLLTGFLFKWWAFGWTFLLFAICIITLIEAIERKKPSHFAYPIFAAAVYCLIGIAFHIWNSTWVLFVTIPLFYLICDIFKKKKD